MSLYIFEWQYLQYHTHILYMIHCQYLLLISESVCIYCLLNLMSMWLSCKDLLYGLSWSDNKLLWFWNINLPPTEWREEKHWHTCYHCQLWMMNIFRQHKMQKYVRFSTISRSLIRSFHLIYFSHVWAEKNTKFKWKNHHHNLRLKYIH